MGNLVEKIKLLIRVKRAIDGVDRGAEVQGLKRLVKVLILGIAGAVGSAILNQTGAACVLGDTACKLLALPEAQSAVAVAIASGLAGLEKYLNEKLGVGIQALDTVSR